MILAISILIGSLLMLWLVAGGENRADGSGRFLSVRRIYGLGGTDYLIRRYLVPRNRFLNVYLHRFSAATMTARFMTIPGLRSAWF